MQLLQVDSFAQHANTTFEVLFSDGAMPLTLIDIQPLANHAANTMRAPFSLIFKSSIQHVLPQNTYRVRDPNRGEVDMFLVPLGRDAQGVTYQAVYN